MMNGLNKTRYRQLLSAFLPHTITTETEYNEVQAEIDRLIDQGELSDEETAYLDLLGTLIWDYETKTEAKANYTLRGVEFGHSEKINAPANSTSIPGKGHLSPTWESSASPFPECWWRTYFYGVALLKGLLELHDLKQKELLPIFKSESIVSAVINGKRKLTVDMINGLVTFFHVPHKLFFEPLPTAKLQAA